jgi:tellurite resistance protein TerC
VTPWGGRLNRQKFGAEPVDLYTIADMEGPFFWIAFNLAILALLAFDLGLFSRRPHVIKFREALAWCAFWIALAAGFAVLVYFWRGPQKALEFTAGYLIEESLSVDNLFVFLMLFNYFRVEPRYQRKVLSWGILGALITRGLFIVVGVGLIRMFHWIIYLFGVFVVYTAYKLLRGEQEQIDPERNWALRVARRWVPITPEYDGDRFFVTRAGRRFATLLFVTVLVVESTDILFAADSIPAVLAISNDPFIVYTSNVFAILGLRSIYFALSGMMEAFHLLHYGLAGILAFIGVKMIISGFVEIPTYIALAVVGTILAGSVAASLIWKEKDDSTTKTRSHEETQA